jgi:hypothetical protein
MLPGFRFLFSAIVLSTSVLVFGLGAAALLRTAHEEFVNLPSRRTAPAPMFARPSDDSLPTLALLRIELPAEEKPADTATDQETAVNAPAAPTPDAEVAETVKEAEPVQAEAAKTDNSARETTAETPVANPDVKLAAIVETPPPAVSPPPPATDIDSFLSNDAMTRIATLGGPAVIVDDPASAATAEAKPDRNAARKQAAEKARERRRMAARRARLAREAALVQQQQLQANPFAHLAPPRATR